MRYAQEQLLRSLGSLGATEDLIWACDVCRVVF